MICRILPLSESRCFRRCSSSSVRCSGTLHQTAIAMITLNVCLTTKQTSEVCSPFSQQNAVQDVPVPDASAKTGILPRPSSKSRLLGPSSYQPRNGQATNVFRYRRWYLELQVCMCGGTFRDFRAASQTHALRRSPQAFSFLASEPTTATVEHRSGANRKYPGFPPRTKSPPHCLETEEPTTLHCTASKIRPGGGALIDNLSLIRASKCFHYEPSLLLLIQLLTASTNHG